MTLKLGLGIWVGAQRVDRFGPQLVTNPDLTNNIIGWTEFNSTTVVNSGIVTITPTLQFGSLTQTLGLTANSTYRMRFGAALDTAVSAQIKVNDGLGGEFGITALNGSILEREVFFTLGGSVNAPSIEVQTLSAELGTILLDFVYINQQL